MKNSFQGIYCKTLVQNEESALDMNLAHSVWRLYTSTNKLISHNLPHYFISDALKIVILYEVHVIGIFAL